MLKHCANCYDDNMTKIYINTFQQLTMQIFNSYALFISSAVVNLNSLAVCFCTYQEEVCMFQLFFKKEVQEKYAIMDKKREIQRDNKLQMREVEKAIKFNHGKMYCPCTNYARIQRPVKVLEAKKHLRMHDKAPNCCVYRGLDENNSSDGEWEKH